MSFANPFWLWGLSALTIPLIIHLLSRKEGKVISVGSLRYLKDANTQQFKSLRLNELLLLILRCLLLSIVVLFISGLLIQKNTKQKWVVLEDKLKDHPQAKSLADSLIAQGYELHSLSTDPPTDKEALSTSSYWALPEQLRSKAISEAVIISTARAEGFKGTRVQSPSSIKWITITPSRKEYLIAAIRNTKDSVRIKIGSVYNENTHYKTSSASSIPGEAIFRSDTDSVSIISPDTIRITLASDPAFRYDKQIVLASLKAIQATVATRLIIKESGVEAEQADSTDVLIWLSEKPLPVSKARTIIYYKGSAASPLFQQESDSQWQLSKRLHEEVALNKNLALELLKIILPDQEQWEVADKKDQRTMPEKMIWSAANDGSKENVLLAGYTPLDHYLIILILIVLITERMIAYKRNQ